MSGRFDVPTLAAVQTALMAAGHHSNGVAVYLPDRVASFRVPPECADLTQGLVNAIDVRTAIAERIAACLNYCANVSNADLAVMPLQEVLGQMRELADETARAQGAEHQAREQLRAALEALQTIAAGNTDPDDMAGLAQRALGCSPAACDEAKIVIEVSGGVAEVTTNTRGLDVTIIDRDNEG